MSHPAAGSPYPQNGTTVVDSVAIGPLSQPENPAIDPTTGDVYVSQFGTNLVTIFSDLNDSVLATDATGDDPFSAVFDPVDGGMYVLNSGLTRNLSEYEGTSLVATVPVGNAPHYAAFDPDDGDVYVANTGSNNVSVVNGSTVVANIGTDLGPYHVVYDAARGWVYVSCVGGTNVMVLNGTTILANVTIGTTPTGLAVDTSTGDVYVTDSGAADVVVLNGTSIATTIGVGSNPTAVAFDPANGNVYVANSVSNNVSVLNGGRVVANIPAGADPEVVGYDPANGFVYVTNLLGGTISVIDGTELVATISGGTTPDSWIFDPRTSESYVANFGSGNVSVLGSNPGPFTLDFNESGLPSGTGWGVRVNATTEYSYGPALAFWEGNGTFPYVASSSSVNYSGPAPGQATVRGTNLTVDLPFERVFPVSFAESGLPIGTNWSVTVGNASHSTTNTTDVVYLANGTHSWTLNPLPGYSTNWSGTVTVAGIGPTVPIAFVSVVYAVTFLAAGLPIGTSWGVRIGSVWHNTTSASVGALLPNGSFPVVAAAGGGYGTAIHSPLVVAGANQSIPLEFALPQYLVSFVETGLPSGTPWAVTVGGSENTSNMSSLSIPLGNGTFGYAIGPVAGYHTSWAGEVEVNGSAVTVPVDFVPTTYALVFTEQGLPVGANWSILVGGTLQRTSGGSLAIDEPNGSYGYLVAPVAGFAALPDGEVTIQSANASVVLQFIPWTYAVTFTESGLPLDTSWGVQLGGTTVLSTTTQATLRAPNGTALFSIVPVPGFTTARWNGTLTVHSAPVAETLDFARVLYRVVVGETGLGASPNWTVEFAGTVMTVDAPTLNLSAANGTYDYSVPSVDGFTGSASGTITVAGTNPNPIAVLFSPTSGPAGIPASAPVSPTVLFAAVGAAALAVAVAAVYLSRRHRQGGGPKGENTSAPSETAEAVHPP